MAKKIPLDPEIQKTLRDELRAVYLKQAVYIQRTGEPSAEIGKEIILYRKRLGESGDGPKKVEKKSMPRIAKRKKAPWRCSYIECLEIIPAGAEVIKARKRHYCSLKCALSDGDKLRQA